MLLSVNTQVGSTLQDMFKYRNDMYLCSLTGLFSAVQMQRPADCAKPPPVRGIVVISVVCRSLGGLLPLILLRARIAVLLARCYGKVTGRATVPSIAESTPQSKKSVRPKASMRRNDQVRGESYRSRAESYASNSHRSSAPERQRAVTDIRLGKRPYATTPGKKNEQVRSVRSNSTQDVEL